MVFNSGIFLSYFLPVFLLVYFLLPLRNLRNYWLLTASLLFYSWAAPIFVFITIASGLADFLIASWIGGRKTGMCRILFWISVSVNLGLLIYFKYLNFFIDQFNIIIERSGGKTVSWAMVLLPVGISFITFQRLSYIIDVYKKRITPYKRPDHYFLQMLMFPQVLSGPIVRTVQISGQITDRKANETLDDKLIGFCRFATGLAKKVLIADVLAVQVNLIFKLSSFELSTATAWIGAIAYTFQIYFDFSGYTDMAIGIARMLGFRLPENFNSPYVSASITEFWRRWHMTLGSWFRDYIFLPLAYKVSRGLPKEKYLGIRADKVIYLVATSVTFLLCGFWHGAAWTFILWGVYQGVFLILDRLFLLKVFKKAGRIPSIIITFLITMFGWVLFRSPDLDYFRFYIRRMFMAQSHQNDIWLQPKFWVMLGIAVVFSFIGGSRKMEKWQNRIYDRPGDRLLAAFCILSLFFFVFGLAATLSAGFTPFIYFKF